MRHFLYMPHRPVDPAFMHEERLFLEHGRDVLAVMEHQREHLVAEIERARELAGAARIPIERFAEPRERTLLALIGIGNRFRHDDAAGLEVARRLRLARPSGVEVSEQGGEPASLLEAWFGVDEALVVDAVSSGADPGTLHRFEYPGEPLPAGMFTASTHALGLAEAVELARELDRLPRRLVVYGIEGRSFEQGEGLTPAVRDTVARLVTELCHELKGRG